MPSNTRMFSSSVTELWMAETPPRDAVELSRLIDRAITGDTAAFSEIVIRHQRRVIMLAWRLLGNSEDAQDAAQEVFLRAFKYLRRFDRNKPLEPWLVGTTVNVCRSLRRKQLKRAAALDARTLLERPRFAPDPHTVLASDEQRQRLYRALDSLAEKERTAVILRDIEGVSTAEVAEILGSRESTVRSQISVARLKLRKTIERMKGNQR